MGEAPGGDLRGRLADLELACADGADARFDRLFLRQSPTADAARAVDRSESLRVFERHLVLRTELVNHTRCVLEVALSRGHRIIDHELLRVELAGAVDRALAEAGMTPVRYV